MEFGASLDISTIHLAAALHDCGSGSLVTTEIDPVKAGALQANVDEAKLARIVDVRIGDALETLQRLPGQIDLLFLDGWNKLYLPVLRLVESQLSPSGMVVADLGQRSCFGAIFAVCARSKQMGFSLVAARCWCRGLDASQAFRARAISGRFQRDRRLLRDVVRDPRRDAHGIAD